MLGSIPLDSDSRCPTSLILEAIAMRGTPNFHMWIDALATQAKGFDYFNLARFTIKVGLGGTHEAGSKV